MNKLKYLIMLIIFAGVLVLAILGYRWLSESYIPDHTPPTAGEEGRDTTETKPTPTPTETESESAAPERTGEEMPDFTVYDREGNTVNLSDYVGKPVVLNFWATWCMPCKVEMPHFEKAYLEYGEDIHFLMVNMTDGYRDTESTVNAFVDKNGYTFPVYYDSESKGSAALGVYSIPRTFFLWEDGTLMDEYLGTMSEDVLYSFLDDLKGEE
ncbi:MAG: TlpA family protein disulfide reductase [Ruminococcaceae bacterium]|nr:TlpA family protein disulfide reductase [Oscillospiraceae bacterium]